MMGDRGAAAIALAISGDPQRRSVRGSPGKRLYVSASITVRRLDGGKLPAQDPTVDVELGSDAQYRVRLSLRRTMVVDGAIPVDDEVELQLNWRGSSVVRISSQQPHIVRPSDLAQGGCDLEFQMELESGAPIHTGSIDLHYFIGDARKSQHMLNVGVTGVHYAAPDAWAEEIRVRLPAVADRKLAVLHVSACNDALTVKGFHPSVKPLSTTILQPPISLADVAGEEPSLRVYKAVLEYCRENAADLLGWLLNVLERTGGDVSILVTEHADSRVPWEMLVLEEGGLPLGARVGVTRWTMIQNFQNRVWLDPREVADRRGLVVRFVDSARLSRSKAEEEELLKCAAVPCDSVKQLTETLWTLPENAALVFLACHGIFAKNQAHGTELMDAKLPGGAITTLDLEGLPRPAAGKEPVLVVNACHSARLVRTQRGVSGLPAFFLASFTKSYLGTIGAVDEEVAADVGARLIKEARAQEGVRIPEFLLRLRREAADVFDGKTKARRFVSAFMYVYYGSLNGGLSLDAKERHD
jgi:hypothetical protein